MQDNIKKELGENGKVSLAIISTQIKFIEAEISELKDLFNDTIKEIRDNAVNRAEFDFCKNEMSKFMTKEEAEPYRQDVSNIKKAMYGAFAAATISIAVSIIVSLVQ